MKKFISLIAGITAIMVAVLCFSSCKGNEEGSETPQDVVNVGYSAEVTENSVKVYKDDVFVQELNYPENKKADLVLAFAQNHISFKDLDFDGNLDLCLALSTAEVGFNYCCWIYNATNNEFVYNEQLSAFSSITVDAVNKHIISTEKNAEGASVFVVYEWVDGQLKKLETKDEMPSSAEGNVLGSVSSVDTTSRAPENSGANNNTTSGSGNSGNTGNTNNQQTDVPTTNGTIVENTTQQTGSGIQLSPDQYGETWY